MNDENNEVDRVAYNAHTVLTVADSCRAEDSLASLKAVMESLTLKLRLSLNV